MREAIREATAKREAAQNVITNIQQSNVNQDNSNNVSGNGPVSLTNPSQVYSAIHAAHSTHGLM